MLDSILKFKQDCLRDYGGNNDDYLILKLLSRVHRFPGKFMFHMDQVIICFSKIVLTLSIRDIDRYLFRSFFRRNEV